MIISKRNKKCRKQCDDTKEDNTIKYITEDNENDSYIKSSLDFITNLKSSMNYFINSNDIKQNENESIDTMKKEIKQLKEKHIILKERLKQINKHKEDDDIKFLENAINIIESENISLKEKIQMCNNNKKPIKNIKHIATVEIARMKSILSNLCIRPKSTIRSSPSTVNISTNKILSDSNKLSTSCKNVNTSKYILNLQANSPSDSERVLFSCRMKGTNDSLNNMMKKINSMSLNGRKINNKNISKLKFSLLKNRQNVTSSTCSTLRKSVI